MPFCLADEGIAKYCGVPMTTVTVNAVRKLNEALCMFQERRRLENLIDSSALVLCVIDRTVLGFCAEKILFHLLLPSYEII